jgi:hypothetical protein
MQWERVMYRQIAGSAGIVPGKTSEGLDMGVEAKKWKEEFGEILGEKMREWVVAAMPDYEFLREETEEGSTTIVFAEACLAFA